MSALVDKVRALYSYDAGEGVLRWREPSSPSVKVGDPVGSVSSKGYLRTEIDGVTYAVHRLIWLYVHGEMPNQIDHINRVVTDNRLSNLRNVTPSENTKNKGLYKNNTSGFAGVCKQGNKWRAFISVDGRRVWLGSFCSKTDAITARIRALQIQGYAASHGKAA